MFRIAADSRAAGDVTGYVQAIDALVEGLVASYQHGYKEFCKTRPSDFRARQMRSALLGTFTWCRDDQLRLLCAKRNNALVGTLQRLPSTTAV